MACILLLLQLATRGNIYGAYHIYIVIVIWLLFFVFGIFFSADRRLKKWCCFAIIASRRRGSCRKEMPEVFVGGNANGADHTSQNMGVERACPEIRNGEQRNGRFHRDGYRSTRKCNGSRQCVCRTGRYNITIINNESMKLFICIQHAPDIWMLGKNNFELHRLCFVPAAQPVTVEWTPFKMGRIIRKPSLLLMALRRLNDKQ